MNVTNHRIELKKELFRGCSQRITNSNQEFLLTISTHVGKEIVHELKRRKTRVISPDVFNTLISAAYSLELK